MNASASLASLRCEPTRGYYALTFDDGFASIMSTVVPIIERYRCPIFISETSHYGPDRGRWLAQRC